jgi:uncharacterized protein YbjT (DUF2867 family)
VAVHADISVPEWTRAPGRFLDRSAMSSSVRTCARAVAAVALASSAHEGRTHRLSGPEALRPAEQVAILAEVTGRPLRFQAQPDAEARAEMEQAMPKEYVDAFFSFLADGTIDESTVLPTVEQVLGSKPRTFRQWAQAHAAAFQ